VSQALNHPNIQVLERSNAVDLIVSDKIGLPGTRRVVGAWVWNRNKETVETCQAKAVVLATGGASKVYQYTTNPDISSGDGIAMAWRAGCRVANLEFNQFHPTALFHPQARNFLLTEALRGEGAHLKRPDGTRFMPDFDPRGELAPRDVVARAIDHEMKRLGVDCMYLDISHKPAEFVRQHFPTIYEKLLGLGIDLTKDPVPVVPAAHYTCGGVMVDDHAQIAMQCFGCVHEEGWRTGAGEGSGNLFADMTRFANSRNNHFAFAVNKGICCADKLLSQPFWQTAGFLELEHQGLTACI
jgi:L-aspartate oxidase